MKIGDYLMEGIRAAIRVQCLGRQRDRPEMTFHNVLYVPHSQGRARRVFIQFPLPHMLPQLPDDFYHR